MTLLQRLRAVCLALCAAFAATAHATDKPPPVVAQPNMPPDGSGGARSHMLYSAGLGLMATAVITPERHWRALDRAIGCGVICQRLGAVMVIGVAKETADYLKGQDGYRHGLFSRRDLQNDLKGAVLGVGAGLLIEGAFVQTRRGAVTVGINKEL